MVAALGGGARSGHCLRLAVDQALGPAHRHPAFVDRQGVHSDADPLYFQRPAALGVRPGSATPDSGGGLALRRLNPAVGGRLWRGVPARVFAGKPHRVTQLVLPLETRSAQGRADFIVAPANQQAVTFLDLFPHWPAPAVALYGPPACGKSHLAAVWAQKAGARIIEAAELGSDLPDGALVVENVAAGVPEAPLFALLERGAPLLLTAQAPPVEWPQKFALALPDLLSRLNALLAFPLWAPDDALLMGLAVKLFADRQVAVPENVVAHMIRSLERSPEAIRDFVARADAVALAEKRPINLNLIKELLIGPPQPSLF